jgi:hypothetical protein
VVLHVRKCVRDGADMLKMYDVILKIGKQTIPQDAQFVRKMID